MKQSISTHQVCNNAGYNGLNVLDKQKTPNILYQARKRYPLMPTWRVYRLSYWSPLQSPCSDKPEEAIK